MSAGPHHPPELQIDEGQIRQTLDLIFPSGQVTELRALDVSTPSYRRPHTVAGYFDDVDALVDSLGPIQRTAKGIYIIPNPINPALLARAANRARDVGERDPLTGDNDIVSRRWFMIDADPCRPAGISSTADQHELAIERVRQIRTVLSADGWADPILADSGNGGHLMYPIDLPRDDSGVMKRALEALAVRFDDEAVSIDLTVFNPARIWKLYGTISRKGDSLPDRPHRLARILEAPTILTSVSAQVITELASKAPTVETGRRAYSGGSASFDLDAWIAQHGLDLVGPTPWQGGRRWVFPICPWSSDHRNRSAYLLQLASGAIAAGCHHNGCAGKDWSALRALYEPARRTGKESAPKPVSRPMSASIEEDQQALQGTPKDDPRPEIDAGVLDLPAVTATAWKALLAANDPPSLFRQGGIITRIETGDDYEPITREITADRMRHVLARAALWVRIKRGDDGETRSVVLPPPHVVRDVLATPNSPLPVLTRIVEAPTFAADGTLETEPGYHAASRSYYAPRPGLVITPVPDRPTVADLRRARGLICGELLGEFPFVGPSEVAHAVALHLLPFIRELIDGPTPLHLIEKPSPGTGASLLVDILIYPILGRSIAAMTEGRDEDEWRKRITAKLRSGAPVLLIDNLRRRLDSAAVSAAITSTRWEDRLLGVSETIWLPVRCAWVATGNNPALSNEMTRRTVRIRLDARLDRPWLRTGFRHSNLRDWVRQHRADLIWAALVMTRAWLVEGRPLGRRRLGMFESWAEVVGGILGVAGIDGFLGNLDAFYVASDAEQAAWHAFLAVWWNRFGEQVVGASDLIAIALETEPSLEIGEGGERSQRTKLGLMIAKARDRQYRLVTGVGSLQVRLDFAGQDDNASRWRLRPVGRDVGDVDEPFPGVSPDDSEATQERSGEGEAAEDVHQRPVGSAERSNDGDEGRENVHQRPVDPVDEAVPVGMFTDEADWGEV